VALVVVAAVLVLGVLEGVLLAVVVSMLTLIHGVNHADLRERSITLWLTNPNDRPLDMPRRLPDADAWERRLFGDLDAAAAHSSCSGDEPRPGRPPR
jgi:hypothetical protein